LPNQYEVPDEHSKNFFPKTFFPDNKLPPPVNFSKFFLQLLLFNKLCKIFCSITYFWPDKRVVEIVKLARRNYNSTILVRGCLTPNPPPTPLVLALKPTLAVSPNL
jgi:hypothetical protein